MNEICVYEIEILVCSKSDLDTFISVLKGNEQQRLIGNHDNQTCYYTYLDYYDKPVDVISGSCDCSVLNSMMENESYRQLNNQGQYTTLEKLTKDLRLAISITSHTIGAETDEDYYIVNGKVFEY
ncbi:hypothetical protein [Mammaliicoccus vitulinus]|uniref:hypothetical protein n=1 Tax=Mammaliicoccus vitulinus TaxID=71237 RepID=UPI00248AA7AC|nr:hypothetical protein [Mammaliicoccus vitulinus]